MIRNRQKKLHHKGMAMTEVLVAFLLLTIIFAMLFHCIRFSSNMIKRATDTDREIAEYESEAAKKFTRTVAADPDPYDVNSPRQLNIKFTDDASGADYSVKMVLASEDVSYHENGDPAAASETATIHFYSSKVP